MHAWNERAESAVGYSGIGVPESVVEMLSQVRLKGKPLSVLMLPLAAREAQEEGAEEAVAEVEVVEVDVKVDAVLVMSPVLITLAVEESCDPGNGSTVASSVLLLAADPALEFGTGSVMNPSSVSVDDACGTGSVINPSSVSVAVELSCGTGTNITVDSAAVEVSTGGKFGSKVLPALLELTAVFPPGEEVMTDGKAGSNVAPALLEPEEDEIID
ncbi:uncharacterized protein MYCGRDRAFT_95368 [Zymoseptoria tritici IPO323]|uniref:Uncharacterized protein n=1 Tax=Zymoseptoria tritici (strain CBS 115943 / IPO323) TaxID=336722 RepID=F9XIS1_ZYMTI|nr:uncharacterized protein MYCGRDRAFT_95368 [Zymoseptoria tritici IPO323]EGP85242.1 hypothetical protein MYCGRDRAFT_95368 [Zymoseptoria tritici IPO323]